ncbi:hypothetical protein QC761_611020 [Podospora bellae-mahoneyi]|uniref:Enoyl reductase (ER) domain-containing protein n=1 Tax=Podospora bellae-mahoneyi TaxID=2093777 RepID=A0ABR0FBY7_9PEZI|nr:hypothetical protein QC761_611020 [Podospora bellae-mahoneyi]
MTEATTHPTALFLSSDGEITPIAAPFPIAASLPLAPQTHVPIKVTHSAIQPADKKHFNLGFHSSITGFDYAGINLTTNTPVLGLTWPGPHRPLHAGAHQPYILARSDLIWTRPEGLSAEAAAGLPTSLLTAADAFINIFGVGFASAGIEQLPSGTHFQGKGVLIWGGASAVGWAAIQVAREIGIEFIFVVASTKNHDLLRGIGATHVFDYTHPEETTKEIKRTLQSLDVTLTAVFDAVGAGLEDAGSTYENSSCYWGKQCLSGDQERDALACARPVPREWDSDWEFAIFSRKWDALPKQSPEWTWSRQDKVMRWFLENHAAAWKPMPTRVVRSKEDAVVAINSSAEGRISCEKVVIRHPIL